MKKFGTILSIVTVLAIIVGSVIHLRSCGSLSYDFKSGEGENAESTFGEIYDKDFDNIDIEMALVEIKVKEGSSFAVDYKGKEKYKPIVKSEGDTLVVSNSDRSFNLSLMGDSKSNKLTVTIPKGKVFDKAKLETVMSDVEIDALNAETLDVSVPTGAINIKESKGKTLKAEVVKGDFSMVGDYTDLDIMAALGNVEIDLAQDIGKYNITANSQLGSIECGDVEVNGASSGSQNGDLGDIKVECSMGSVKIY